MEKSQELIEIGIIGVKKLSVNNSSIQTVADQRTIRNESNEIIDVIVEQEPSHLPPLVKVMDTNSNNNTISVNVVKTNGNNDMQSILPTQPTLSRSTISSNIHEKYLNLFSICITI